MICFFFIILSIPQYYCRIAISEIRSFKEYTSNYVIITKMTLGTLQLWNKQLSNIKFNLVCLPYFNKFLFYYYQISSKLRGNQHLHSMQDPLYLDTFEDSQNIPYSPGRLPFFQTLLKERLAKQALLEIHSFAPSAPQIQHNSSIFNGWMEEADLESDYKGINTEPHYSAPTTIYESSNHNTHYNKRIWRLNNNHTNLYGDNKQAHEKAVSSVYPRSTNKRRSKYSNVHKKQNIIESLKAELTKLESPKKAKRRQTEVASISNPPSRTGVFTDPQNPEDAEPCRLFQKHLIQEINRRRKQSMRVSQMIKNSDPVLPHNTRRLVEPLRMVNMPAGNSKASVVCGRVNLSHSFLYQPTKVPEIPGPNNTLNKTDNISQKLQSIRQESRLSEKKKSLQHNSHQASVSLSGSKENQMIKFINKKKSELYELKPHKRNKLFYVDRKERIHLKTLSQN